MKKIFAIILITVALLAIVSCNLGADSEPKHKLEIVCANGTPIHSDLEDSYAAGEIVTIKLESFTEQYYRVFVNGKEQAVSSSNGEFVYYYFKMPSEDVTVKIEEHWEKIHSSLSTYFSEYLDSINFIERLSQSDLLNILEKYSYNGKAITDDMNIAHDDGLLGGGMFGGTKLFGFENDYTVTEDSQYANYSNEFYTRVKLEGFSLPYGVKFEYTLENILQNFKPYIDIPDDLNKESIILYADDTTIIELSNYEAASKNGANVKYSYEIKYTETYKTTLVDGREDTVTRCISMLFASGSNKLDLLTVSVNEKYMIN